MSKNYSKEELDNMKITSLKKIAKQLKIRGYTTFKKDTKKDLENLILQKTNMDKEERDNILEESLDELDDDRVDRVMEDKIYEMEEEKEEEEEKENASERVARVMRENQQPQQAVAPRQVAPRAPVKGNLLTKGLVELARIKGASESQLKVLSIVSNKVQQAYGDKNYFKSGKWIQDIAENLLPAELKAVNWFQKAVGWYDDKDAEELDKIMDGKSDLSTLQQISITTRAITSLKGLSQLTQRVIDQGVDDITQGVEKANKIMKGEYRTEKDVRDEIDEMEINEIAKKKIKKSQMQKNYQS